MLVGGCRNGFGENDLLRHARRMLVAKVAVGLHRQRTTVLVPKPARNRWDVHARFNAACGEQVAQIVMGESSDAQLLASRIDRALAFMDARDGVGREIPRAPP